MSCLHVDVIMAVMRHDGDLPCRHSGCGSGVSHGTNMDME